MTCMRCMRKFHILRGRINITMRYRLIPILITLVVIIIGHIVKRKKIKKLNEKKSLTIVFDNLFVDFINDYFRTGRINQEKYAACMHDIDAIQEEVGYEGIVADFVDPLRSVKGHNYQLFVNIMPEIRSSESMSSNSIMMERVSQLVGLCEDALHRHVGNLDRKIESATKVLWNPFSCFGEGIRMMIGIPIDILYWCGLIGITNSQRARGSWIFKVLSWLFTIIGLISSLITILLGWDETRIILNDYLQR